MNHTKERICEAAITLFNEKGYDNVSLREIAEAAGTTIGNMTYHFRQKEKLVEWIQENLQDNFLLLFQDDQLTGSNLESLIQSFFEAEKNQLKHPFYYKDFIQLSRSSDLVEGNNQIFRKKLYEYLCSSFQHLQEQNILKPEADQVYQTLSYTIVFLIPLWTQSPSPYFDPGLPRIFLADALCSLISPYILPQHLEEFHSIRQKHRTQI